MKKIIALAIISITSLSACEKSGPEPTEGPNLHPAAYEETSPEITGILIKKADREMVLVSHGRRMRYYNVDLGFEPEGDKRIQGDGRTPEGTYRINRKNPQSNFFLSIGLDYPNARDIAEARALGKAPGGDIFIHGQGRWGRNRSGTDWTEGCIAITDDEMKEVFRLVQIGTPVTILP